MKMNKGQGSTEYLVILGGVLLVALITISVLGWFPALGGSTREAQSQVYWESAIPLSITTYKITSAVFNFSISSRVGDKLNLTLVQADDGLSGPQTIWNSWVVVNPGEEKWINSSAFTTGNLCAGQSSGTPFEYKTIIFTYTQGGITGIKQTGAKPLAGKCS